MIFKLASLFLIIQLIVKLNANPYGPKINEHVAFEELNQTDFHVISNDVVEKTTVISTLKVTVQETTGTVPNNVTAEKETVSRDENSTIASDVPIATINEVSSNLFLNSTFNETVELEDEDLSLNQTRDDSKLTGSLVNATSNKVFRFFTSFKIVSFETSNTKRPLEKLSGIEQLIKHALLKTFGSAGNIDVELNSNNSRMIFDSIWPNKAKLPIYFSVSIKSPVELNEDQFESSLIDFSINGQKCTLSNNETSVRCSTFKQKDPNSLLRLSDYWIELNHLAASAEKLNAVESEIFTYKPAWIIGLSVIGCIIAIFFLGCIIAICYTRRPYRKSGKIYEIESAVRKNKNNQVPNIPGIHPGTKTSTVTKTKEMYYE